MDEVRANERAGEHGGADGEGGLPDWLDQALIKGLVFPETDSEAERAFKRAAARAMVSDLVPAEAGTVEQLLAVQFVCAHVAAIYWQGRSNAPGLTAKQRASAQESACDLMELTTRQLSTLADLQEAREQEAVDQAARAARKQAKERPRKAEADRGPARGGGKPRVLH